MPSKTQSASELAFQPRARLIRTIGDRLISGPEAAVIELVKNAHDADASYVSIRFIPPLVSDSGAILIEDDGHGMTLEDIREKWMEPATSDKRDRKYSPSGRRLLGSKGIGRFAAASLGKNLELISTAHAPNTVRTLETTTIPNLDWEEFESTKYLADIRIPFESSRGTKGQLGTRLKISKLRDDWTKSALESLHKELRRLISPLSEKESEQFKIYLDLTDCTGEAAGFDATGIVNGVLADPKADPVERNRVRPYTLLNACDYEIDGAFSEEGRFTGTMEIHRAGGGKEIISIDIPIHSEVGEVPCGELLVHLAVFDREADAIDNTIKKAGLGDVGRREARRILDEMCGIAIYRDNFRIRPYGDSDQDWLTLDSRRVQDPSRHIGHNQVAGLVIVDSEERSGLVERSSREGLENNGHFRRLTRLIRELLGGRVEPRRQMFREGAGVSRTREKNPLGTAYKAAQLSWAEEVIQKVKPADREEVREKISIEAEKLRKFLEEAQEQQARLQSQVTLGLILAEVLHEGRAPVSFIQTESRRLAKWLPTICGDTKTAEQRRTQEVPDILRGLEASADTLRRLFKLLEPISGRKRGPPSVFNPVEAAEGVLKLFSSRIQSEAVDVRVIAPKSEITAFGYEDDLLTALTNVTDNALYWLDHNRTQQPKIRIEVSQHNGKVEIDFFDNGPGLPDEFENSIFGVGFTLKPNGTGLGLPIAREAIERSQGTITLRRPSTGNGFGVRITLPTSNSNAHN